MAGLKAAIPQRPDRPAATFPSGWPSPANSMPSAAPSVVPSVPHRGRFARSVHPIHRDYAALEAFCTPPNGGDPLSAITGTNGIRNRRDALLPAVNDEWYMCTRCYTTFPIVHGLDRRVNEHQCWPLPQNPSMIIPGPEPPHWYDCQFSPGRQSHTTQTSARGTTGAFDTDLSFATQNLAAPASRAHFRSEPPRRLETYADVRGMGGGCMHPATTRMAGGSIDASIAGDRGWMRQTALEKLFREDDELFREEEKLFREEEKRWHQQEERCWEMEPSSLR